MAETLQEFVVNLKYAVDTASQDNFISVLRRVATSVGGVAAEIGGLAVAVLALGKTLAETGSQFHFMSERLGSSVGDIQAASYAMQQLGASSEEAVGSIERFGAWTRNMGPAATNYLRALGVTATDTVGRMKQLGEYFRTHGGNLAQQGSLEYSVALRRAGQMGIDENTMNRLASGDMERIAREGGVIQRLVWGVGTPEQLKAKQDAWSHKADEVIGQFNKMGLIFDTMKQKFGSALFDKLLPELEKLNEFLLHNQATFQKWFDVAATVLGGFVRLVGTGIETFMHLPKAIEIGLAAMVAWGPMLSLLKSPLFWFITALTTLLLILDDYAVYKKGGRHAIDWDMFQGAIDTIGGILKPLRDAANFMDDWIYKLTGVCNVFSTIAAAVLLIGGRMLWVKGIDMLAGGLGALFGKGKGAPVVPPAAPVGKPPGGGGMGFWGLLARLWPLLLIGPAGGEDPEFSDQKNEEWKRNHPKPGPDFVPWYKRAFPGLFGLDQDLKPISPDRYKRASGAGTPNAVAGLRGDTSNMFAGEGAPSVGYQGEDVAPAGGGWARKALLARFGMGEDGGVAGAAPSLAGVGAGGPEGLGIATGGDPMNILTAYFMAQGWTREQTAGIIANLKAESSTFNPGEVGDRGLAYGIAQWHPDRQAMFYQVMGRPIRGSSLLQQAAFVQWELTHTEANAGRILRGQTTARGAGAAVSRYYERPGDVFGEMDRRGGTAESIAAGAPLGSGGGYTGWGGSGGGGGGGGGVTLNSTVTINVAAGPTATATATAVAEAQTRVNQAQVRSAQGTLV